MQTQKISKLEKIGLFGFNLGAYFKYPILKSKFSFKSEFNLANQQFAMNNETNINKKITVELGAALNVNLVGAIKVYNLENTFLNSNSSYINALQDGPYKITGIASYSLRPIKYADGGVIVGFGYKVNSALGFNVRYNAGFSNIERNNKTNSIKLLDNLKLNALFLNVEYKM
jgi:hypothetical protein